ncbi:MAG: hypothetical protein IK088_02630, partial [Lachnospiraceae bacterium]|nr:hypothetical protein [Lachnospiraceae bacterium]
MKKWLCLLCASVLGLSIFLSACVTSVEPDAPTKDSIETAEPTTPEPTEKPTEAPTEEPTEPAPAGPTTFSKWFRDNALIGRIPALITKSSLYGEVLDVGDK